MAINNNIVFKYAQGGLNIQPAGTDYISGIVFKSVTTPSGFSFSTPQQILSIYQAENLGIFGNYQDETAATSTLTVGTTASAGTTIGLQIIVPSINSTFKLVDFGTYTLTTLDQTGTLPSLITNIANFINSQYPKTGYAAVTSGTPINSIVITSEIGQGVILNGTTPTIIGATGLSASASAFSGGVNSIRKQEHYQISEFFRMNQNGSLWVDYEQSFGDWTCLNNVQSKAGNLINQFAVYNVSATASATITSDLNAIQAACVQLSQPQEAPAIVIYAPNLYSTTNLGTLTPPTSYNNKYLYYCIEQDGGALGAHLSQMYSYSIPAIGNQLGMVSISNVSQNIGNPIPTFNQSNGVELEVVAFTNRQLYSTLATTQWNLIVQLDAYGFIFGRKLANYTGTYINDNPACIVATSDYSKMNLNRVVNKAQRLVYQALVPFINANINVNSDGSINVNSIAAIKNACNPALDTMIAAGNIDGYPIKQGSSNNSIYINPNQNILSTGVLYITVNILPIAIARSIQVTLGFTI